MFDLVENYNLCLESIDVASTVAGQQPRPDRVHFEMTNLVVRIRVKVYVRMTSLLNHCLGYCH